MKMELKHIRNGIVSCVLGFAAVNAAYSDGYRNPPPTAEGIGKSGANMVFVDDASAIFYNPANLAGATNSSFVFSMTIARTDNEYTSDYPGIPASSGISADGDWQPLPNLFFSTPVGENGIVAGLGISTPFGQGAEYDKEDLVNPLTFGPPLFLSPAIHDAQVAMVNFNPTIAIPVGDNFAVGIGADIYYSELEFKQFYPWSLALLPDQNAEADGDGIGVGGNIGVTWDVTEKQSLAFTYRSEFTIDYEGDLDVSPQGIPLTPQLVNSSFDMEITYPNIIGAGYGIVLGENVRVEANLEWLEWSSNKSLDADLGSNGKLSIPQDWDDTFTAAIGGDWQVDENWVLRAGYAFIESPIPDSTMAPILPDADRHALSLGIGYSTGGHAIDVAYTYSIYDDRDASVAENPAYPGDYDIDSDLFGLTYSYSF